MTNTIDNAENARLIAKRAAEVAEFENGYRVAFADMHGHDLPAEAQEAVFLEAWKLNPAPFNERVLQGIYVRLADFARKVRSV
jgi:hypothetical protein